MLLGSRATGGLVSVRVTTGGAGYTGPPTVTVSGGGGTGVTAYCQMNGSAVGSVILAGAGTGFTSNPTVAFSGGGGTGAQAVAYACTTSRPISFFKGRYADVYGVDGMGRGVRWDGSSTGVESIGLNPPAYSPALTASSTVGGRGVKSVQLLYGGAGYYATPSVVFNGGTPSRVARATATLSGGRVTAIKVTDPGAGYQAVPTVTLSGGLGGGASLTAGVIGGVSNVYITSFGSGYAGTVAPTVSFATTNGLTGALISVSVDEYGRIGSGSVLAAGTGATTTGVSAAVSGAGTGAQVSLGMRYRVNAVTVSSSGSGYYVAPVVTFRPNAADPLGNGASASATVNSAGQITGVTIVNGGNYSLPPEVLVESTVAEAQAELTSPMTGLYKCCIRYLDDTPTTQGGPIASSISELVEVDAGSGSGSLTWSFTHGALDARVSAMELWRTTAGQSVILFRVATIQRADSAFTGTYTDSLADGELTDTSRDGYALMPVTLPSGQVNARRFGVPPGEFAVGCMFQDRAWYAVDVTGQRPNALVYSEVDEPESVPEANELIVQENTGEPDKIVALVPLGATLLVVQSAHIYKLTYVAQPVIDASVTLAANRGALHSRCWATLGGVVFLVDSQGMYAFDGNQEEGVSIAVDNYWRDGQIDFSKAHKFHVSADAQTRTVRFYFCGPSDSEPIRALVYCVATKAWWEERYDTAVTAACRSLIDNRLQPVCAVEGGFRKSAGTSDNGTPIPYQFRSGAMPLAAASGSRSVDVLFAPTEADCTLKLAMHYNNSSQPRPNAISSDRGGAFVTTAGGTAALLNLKKSRSTLGDASGQARAYYSGRADDRSVGADKHLAVDISGEQAADKVVIHTIAVDGVG